MSSSYGTMLGGLSNMTMDTASIGELPPMAIPIWRSTTTGSIISNPHAKSLLSDCPNDIFLRPEERRMLPESLTIDASTGSQLWTTILGRLVTGDLIESYF